MITVVGMGRNGGDLTVAGMQTVKEADVVLVRSCKGFVAETVAKIRQDVTFCDDEIAAAQDFDELNELVVTKLQSFGKRKVAFCVEGDGATDPAAQLLCGAQVVAGVGLQATAVGANRRAGTVIYSARELLLVKRVLPVPTAVTQIIDKRVASEVQLKLQQVFDCDNDVIFADGESVKYITLNELCSQNFHSQTAIYVLPKKLVERRNFEYYDCVDIMQILRSPNGCPWDRAQTHQSIVKNVIEEAYELANALQNEDIPNIVEELGDLLMQVLFHLEIGAENGEYEPSAVYTALCCKLIDRHPHVFGDVKANSADESLDVWTAQKLKEHKIKNLTENITDVPRNMSALMRSQKVQSRASKGGFDFSDRQQILDKLQEELKEFLNAPESERLMEGGDLLFVVVNLLRFCGVDSETALLASCDKFIRRVAECERILTEKGQELKTLPQEVFDEIWDEAKQNVG